MQFEKINIVIEEYGKAELSIYCLDNSVEMDENRTRPLILICPGGGYCMTSEREAEPIAIQYLAMGFHAAVLKYSVKPVKYPAALLQLGESMKYLKDNAAKYHIHPEKIFLQGFSAGGHLVCCLGIFWNKEWLQKKLKVTGSMIKPAGMILSYPVITAGEYGHRGSFENLLSDKNEWQQLSLENQVSKDTVPAFIWHTEDDEEVPVENSLFLFMALHRVGVPVELHIYPHGKHGLSLANKETNDSKNRFVEKNCQNWIKLARNWIKIRCAND